MRDVIKAGLPDEPVTILGCLLSNITIGALIFSNPSPTLQ
jgi:hypothetical protein